MPMASGPDRYLVVGNPIAHSRSPEIHAAFAAQTGQHILYERRLIETDPPEAFAAAMRHFFQDEGGRGANVTLPFKEAAFRLADERSPRAEAAGAANTLYFIEGRIIADNTDGAGLVDDIQRRLGVSLQGLRVTVLGAGGAARGLMLPLAQAGVARLVVANRTLARAQALAADIDPHLEAQALPVRVEPVALADAPAGGSAEPSLESSTPRPPACMATAPRCRPGCSRAAVWPTTASMPTGPRPSCSRPWRPGCHGSATAWACWSARPPRASACGGASGPMSPLCWKHCARHADCANIADCVLKAWVAQRLQAASRDHGPRRRSGRALWPGFCIP